jgi:hypothetical protein
LRQLLVASRSRGAEIKIKLTGLCAALGIGLITGFI